MKFLNILQQLYCEPLAIMPMAHHQISEVVRARMENPESGSNYLPD